MSKIKIFPSFLSADFSRIADEAKRIEDAGADGIHLDIMDGHFVPNLSMGPKIVEAINKSTDLFLDVHLMMYNPYDYVERFIEAGADSVGFHFEATEDVEDTLNYINKAGKQAVLAFNPETSVSMSLKYLDKCDGLLFMSVNPGFCGQEFLPQVLDKIEFINSVYDKFGVDEKEKELVKKPKILVDGGINSETAALCKERNVDVVISGNYLFSQPDLKKAIEKLKANG